MPHRPEGQHVERKSLRLVAGPRADLDELAVACVAFANGAGGDVLIGIEDGHDAPPPDQRIERGLPERLRKRVGELTVNVDARPELLRHENGGEYIALHVSRSAGVASTSDGRYFLRVDDECQPLVGDDVLRLIDERPAVSWEVMKPPGAVRAEADPDKVRAFVAGIRASRRVKASVKEKSDDELLAHYQLTAGPALTNLGVLLLGTAAQRARIATAPIVQFIKYDERNTKTNKLAWDDHTLSPVELVDAIWREIPDFRESYEIPDGLRRTAVPAFEEAVVRELLVNALVHRPYTHRGDIYLNLHPDRLEVVNPGRLPLGITPRNILHASRRRNELLARVFHDLELMEREGSGFDLLYEHLLASGRQVPLAREGVDSVHVTVPRRVLRPEAIRLLREAGQRFPLTQRERIALGLLAQDEGLTAAEFTSRLELPDAASLRTWVDRLLEWGLVQQTGRTRATRYFVPPALLRSTGADVRTTLKRVEPHRLRALILEDLDRYPDSSSVEVNRRVGPEIGLRTVKRALDALVAERAVEFEGDRRWRKYRLRRGSSKGHSR